MKAHFKFSNFFFFTNKQAFYENVQKYCTAGLTTDDNTATCGLHGEYLGLQTLSTCSTYSFSAAAVVARTCLNVTLYANVSYFLLKILFAVYFETCS